MAETSSIGLESQRRKSRFVLVRRLVSLIMFVVWIEIRQNYDQAVMIRRVWKEAEGCGMQSTAKNTAKHRRHGKKKGAVLGCLLGFSFPKLLSCSVIFWAKRGHVGTIRLEFHQQKSAQRANSSQRQRNRKCGWAICCVFCLSLVWLVSSRVNTIDIWWPRLTLRTIFTMPRLVSLRPFDRS